MCGRSSKNLTNRVPNVVPYISQANVLFLKCSKVSRGIVVTSVTEYLMGRSKITSIVKTFASEWVSSGFRSQFRQPSYFVNVFFVDINLSSQTCLIIQYNVCIRTSLQSSDIKSSNISSRTCSLHYSLLFI